MKFQGSLAFVFAYFFIILATFSKLSQASVSISYLDLTNLYFVGQLPQDFGLATSKGIIGYCFVANSKWLNHVVELFYKL